MFTGIIEDIGVIASIGGGVLRLATKLDDIFIGDSISVNGICLTVARIKGKLLSFDYTPETLAVTTLGKLRKGYKVNLERALKASSRLGGHIVSGHVEAIGSVLSITKAGNSQVLRVSLPAVIENFVTTKGSIAVDGISLTVAEAERDWFSVSVIPHTLKNTTLFFLTIGSTVNLEADIMARYRAKKDDPQPQQIRLTSGFLKENGFI